MELNGEWELHNSLKAEKNNFNNLVFQACINNQKKKKKESELTI